MRLKADYKNYLTQVEDVEVSKREFHESVYIAKSEEALTWRQVSETEKAQILAAGTVLGVDNLDAAYLTQAKLWDADELLEKLPAAPEPVSSCPGCRCRRAGGSPRTPR